MVAYGQAKNTHSKTVILGNSLVSYYNWDQLSDQNTQVIGSGVADFTSHQLSWVLEHNVLNHAPQKCIIIAGQEDFFLEIEPERVAANFMQLANSLAAKSVTPIMTSIIKLTNQPELNKAIHQSNALIRQQFLEKGYAFIDLNSFMSDENGLKAAYTTDGFHLNESGYEVVKNLLTPIVLNDKTETSHHLQVMDLQQLSAERIKRILSSSPAEVNITMLGNSITEMGGDWNKKLNRKDIRNCGQGGYSTGQMLWHLDTLVLQANPKICTIMGGINDLSMGVALKVIYKNILEIIHRLQEHNIEPVIQSTLYEHNRPKRHQTITELNKKLKAYCDQNNIKFINVNSVLADENGLIKEYTTDGTHLTEKGYAVWSKFLRKELIKKLNF